MKTEKRPFHFLGWSLTGWIGTAAWLAAGAVTRSERRRGRKVMEDSKKGWTFNECADSAILGRVATRRGDGPRSAAPAPARPSDAPSPSGRSRHTRSASRPARALRTLAVFLVALACLFAFPTLAEAQAPTVIATGRVSAAGTYNLGDTISLSVTFSAAVTVTGTPQLALVIGTDTTPRANYASGSGTQTLQFDYEVAAGDEDTDGIAFPVNALALNGGTITASGTAAVLDHGRMSFTGLLVDGSRPAVRILVSNSGQLADDSANTSGNDHAQLFQTGAHAAGYTLTQVVVNSEDSAGDDFDVEVCEEDGTADEFPSTTAGDCTALTAPASFAAGNLHFPHAGLALSANTNYVVVIKQIGTGSVELNTTTSGGEDTSLGLSDWSIKNKFYWQSGSTWMLKSGGDEALRIIVRGYANTVADATDATLSALSVSGATLSPAFGSSTTSYHAVVANSVNQVTITQTTSETTATVEYLDDSDATLTDADTMTADLQVNLSVGTNTVKVKVTAPDTTTTETYTVNVLRIAVPVACSPASMTNRIWTGNLTVGTQQGATAVGYGGSFGSLDNTTFSYNSNAYSIDVLNVDGTFGILVFSLGTATLGTDANDLILHIGTEPFALADADSYTSGTNSYSFHTNAPTWADGDAVCLALTVDGPEVSSVALTSTPGSDNTYAIGDSVAATVTFDAAVDITGSPQLELDFDGAAKAAGCAAATNTTTMACSYTVLAGEEAPNGVAIAANKLTGGNILATGSTTAADLTHSAVAIAADHKVDGIRPTLVTTGTDAPTTSTDGETVLLVFSEAIGAVDRTKITIQANSVTATTSAASVAGTKVEITLTTPLTASATNLTVELAADAVEDTASNGNLALAATPVTNAVPPNAAPEFSDSAATRSVPENTAANTNIGAALPAATDGDNDPLTYTLEDADAASFGFNATTRQLSTKSGVTYDHETQPSYSVTLKAEDDNGGSGTLAVTITITDVEEPPGRPAAPSVTAVDGSTTSLSVNWTAPSNTGPDIDNYDLRYREGTTGSWTDGPQNQTVTNATIPGLTESTSYQVQVLARNAEGDSPWSPPGSGQTGAQGAPDVPTGLSATRGNRQVMLSWVQPSGGAEVTHYEYEQDVSGAWISTRSTDTDYTVRNLTNGQSYTFRVRAANSAGQSAPSAASASVTPATVPGAPKNIGVTGGDEQVALNWTAPASDGGETITGYEYEQNGSGAWTSTGGTAPSATVTGLMNGLSYRFKVRALNSVGAGAASAASASVTPARVPNAPTSLNATVSDQSVVLIWAAPASNGGAAILRYEYELDFSGTWTSTGGKAPSTTVRNLTNGQSYTFRVRAVNRAGESAASASQSATPTATLVAPDTPFGLSATPGNQRVRLGWVQPSGGAALTHYEYELDGSGAWTSTGSTAPSYTVMGLTNEQSYSFRVRAVNSAGPSGASGSQSATPTVTEPEAPQRLRSTPGDGQVRLRWAAPPNDGGDPITHYEYELDFSGTWISTGSAVPSATVTGLMNGRTYTFRVRAVNAQGNGDVVMLQATPSRPTGGRGPRTTAPDAPGNLTAAAADGVVTLSWDAPSGTGGAPITDYEYQIDGEGEWISIGSVKRVHTITGLAGGTVHVFRVRAVNRAGAGRASDPAEVTLPVLVVLDFTHFANGGGITSEMVLVSVATHPIRPALYFYDRQGLLVDPASVVDLTMDLEVTESGSLTVRTGMDPLGVLTIATHGRGDLVSGSVAVVSDGPLGGGVRYTVPHAGVTGAGASPPVGDVVFPARRQEGGIRTAASLHNLEEEAVEVTCRLMSGGVALEQVEISLEANGQSSWFIEDAFMTDTSDFLGSVRCTAAGSREFTAIAIETDAARGIYTTLPVMEVDRTGGRGGETVLDFAHLANGGWITELVFVNLSIQPSRPALFPWDLPILPSRPAIYFYDTEGNPIAPGSLVDLTSGLEVTDDGALTVSTQMKPLGQLTIPTHGRGELVTGSVRVVSEGPIGGMLRFEHSAYGAAGVGPGLPLSEAVFPVWRREGGITTGFALHNLEEEAAEVTCDLMREGGVLDTVSLPLEANGQTSWTIQDAFPMTDTSDFAGAVRCSAGGGLFTALALEMDSGVPLITALPLAAVEERRYRERSVAENSPAGTDVGAPVAATDPDGGDTPTFSLAGVDAESFTIVASSGQIRTRSGVSYDHETRARYAVEVSVTGGTDSALVVIRVADVDEQPETPAAPEVEADAEAAGSLEVSWTEPGRNGGPKLKGYRLRYRKSAGRSWTELEETVAGTRAAISGLDAGTIYQVQVQALNGETPSQWSPSGTGATR